jgi:flagellar biosynthetic protein FlhB
MAEESGQEKSFDPTESKLREERKKGNIAQSQEVSGLSLYLALGLVIVAVAGPVCQALMILLTGFLVHPETLGEQILHGVKGSNPLGKIVWVLAPVFGLFSVAIFVALIAQRSLVFAPDRIKPKLSNVSPLSNAKKKYGKDGLVEFLKRGVKLSVVTIFATLYMIRLVKDVAPKIDRSELLLFQMLQSEALILLGWMIVATIAIALVDAPWAWWTHRQKLRMTYEEIKEDNKKQEGDPHVKAERRARAQAIAKGTMLRDVATADIVIVNPTHYAVALKWDRASGSAPICVAKGVDHFAAAIREKAKDADVTIHSDPPTARAIYAVVEVGEEIRPEHYAAVAVALKLARSLHP